MSEAHEKSFLRKYIAALDTDGTNEAKIAEMVRQALREGDVQPGGELNRVLAEHEETYNLASRNALSQSLTFQTRARRMVGLAMEQVEKLRDEELQSLYEKRDGVRAWIDGVLQPEDDYFDVIEIVLTCGRDPAYGLTYAMVLNDEADKAAHTLEKTIVEEVNDTERGIEWRKRMKSRLQPSRSS